MITPPDSRQGPLQQSLLPAQNHLGDENWMMSYLDVFILLSMMFIVLLALSDDTPTPAQAELTQSDIIQEEQQSALQEAPATARPTPKQTPQSTTLEHWQEQVHQVLDSLKLKDDIALSLEDEFVKLQIQDRMLFDSAKAEIKPEGRGVLLKLVPLFEMAEGVILVEGHTDNIPIGTSTYPSNWELGAARASSVVNYLASQGMEQSRFRAISYADTKPLALNNTEENRQKNRRVALLLRMPDQE
ncbi:OmpA family protein [Pleionea sp. CnH1-48]|uniref:OmpA/MotB family protein n=1 Tax=Pleionea sp. CnH1-48 TaxID=2954494 RepID=UPI002097A1C5|nr:OmpA family protein [Pleionea sp. CnH1-48]MCO7225161.1 OmpA family protein [Pleionea sp. CnH1-48]